MNAARSSIAVVVVSISGGLAFAQETLRVSVDSSGGEGNGRSLLGRTSADGQLVALSSFASNFVAGDTNSCDDVFVIDRVSGAIERVSVDTSGAQGYGESDWATISADGQLVAFESLADSFFPNDWNYQPDVFVHDRTTGVTECVSVSPSGKLGDTASLVPSITPDGRFVVFSSYSTNLVAGDTNNACDVFVRDRVAGTTERVSVDSSGVQGSGNSGWLDAPVISADGQIVAFSSSASNLVGGDTNKADDLFVHDRASGTTERISIDSSAKQANGSSWWPSISADGKVLAFISNASNLVAGDQNGFVDVFVHDRTNGATERVSVDSSGAEGNGDCSEITAIAPDGGRVAFASDASNLVAGDTNHVRDIFVRNRSVGFTERVSINSVGVEGKAKSDAPTFSADGTSVLFVSDAPNLVQNDQNKLGDTFLHEFCTTPASWSNYGAGFPGTRGVPQFTARQNPVLGATVTLDLDNSYANPTVGLIFLGYQRADVPTSWGFDLLVAPALDVPITFSYSWDWFSADLPNDDRLCGVVIDLQAIEADPGAAHGLSSTPGLELVLGM